MFANKTYKQQFIMKPSTIVCLVLSANFLVSCGYKKEAKEVTQDFFSAIKNNKEEKMVELYPEVGNLQNYYKSDTIIVKEVKELEDKKYSVALTNKFTNGFGKNTESDIIIYTKPKDDKKPSDGYVIYDSKGLCNLSDDPIYMFAKRKGYIQGDTLTDQQISKKYSEASTAIISLSLKFYTYLTENVTIANWNWETSDYSYSASGRGVVRNNTQYTIPNVKYVVTYLKGNGTEVTQDDGYVTYDEIRPYGMKSFSFYTSYVGDASRAKIRLEFDNDFILKTVADGEFE